MRRVSFSFPGTTWDTCSIVAALDQKWFIPSTILPSNLSTSIGALQQYLADPPSLGADSKSLLRKGRKPRARRLRGDDDDDDDAPRQRRKKVAEVQNYKSAAFIEDSDDDEEADRAFFEREKALRAEMEELSRRQGSQIVPPVPKTKEKRQQVSSPIESDDSSNDDDVGHSRVHSRSRRVRKNISPDLDDSEESESDSSDVDGESGQSASPVRHAARDLPSPSPPIPSSPPEVAVPTQGVKRKAKRLIASDSEDD